MTLAEGLGLAGGVVSLCAVLLGASVAAVRRIVNETIAPLAGRVDALEKATDRLWAIVQSHVLKIPPQ